ncbi:LysR family transcriptional regulator [Pseudomonas sp. GD04158]|uniref:LysR family transcriptional regulator n=1 Tax=Pseudomonas sp. GD04158 TaxID=2975439 RepID=UPI003260EC64
MRIRHLRYFLVVAEELSFSRAAARVHIDPPLSRAIRELESGLGVSLFQRTKAGMHLTWAGEVFRDEARRILSLVEDAQSRVRAAEKGYRGRLRIGTIARSSSKPFSKNCRTASSTRRPCVIFEPTPPITICG